MRPMNEGLQVVRSDSSVAAVLQRLREQRGPFRFPVATAMELRDAEATMELTLPSALRRLYTEVANGGFGPGLGILGVADGYRGDQGTLEQTYRGLRRFTDPSRVMERDDPAWGLASEQWPWYMVQFCNFGDGHAWYIDARDGRILFAGPHFVAEGVTYNTWFQLEAPSLITWLDEWMAGVDLPHAFQT